MDPAPNIKIISDPSADPHVQHCCRYSLHTPEGQLSIESSSAEGHAVYTGAVPQAVDILSKDGYTVETNARARQ
jgi:hypothetical protein